MTRPTNPIPQARRVVAEGIPVPITPEQARAHLLNYGAELGEIERRALETIAHMVMETDHSIVSPFTNGGRYRTPMFVRYSTLWREEEQ